MGSLARRPVAGRSGQSSRWWFCLAWLLWGTLAAPCGTAGDAESSQLRIAYFACDVSPPIGTPLAYDACREVTDPLSCRGLVLVGAGDPIVIATIDWLGVGNATWNDFRAELARAAGTTPERVTLHALHQHDAPTADWQAERLAAEVGITGLRWDGSYVRQSLDQITQAVTRSLGDLRPINALAIGTAEVEQVASNRRLLDERGQVVAVRFTACRDEQVRDQPVGTIDPRLVSLVLMDDQEPVLVLTYYATHPQSYYRTGGATPDFPGLARDRRQAETGVPHLHFTGAAGNIGAGKWNDGDPANRAVLTERVRLAMQRAFDQALEGSSGAGPTPLTAADIQWQSLEVRLPLAAHLQRQQLESALGDSALAVMSRLNAAMQLAYLREHQAGQGIVISRWRIGAADALHMPAELFVEYQLAAQRLQPDRTVAMAAYGQYGPQYIGTAISYSQGGYETSPRASCVDQRAERILMEAIAELLGVPATRLTEVLPLGVPVDAPVAIEGRTP
jgi:hypothetical protein